MIESREGLEPRSILASPHRSRYSVDFNAGFALSRPLMESIVIEVVRYTFGGDPEQFFSVTLGKSSHMLG